MGKEIVTKFNYDLEVVETKALMDEWKGVALTWWSVDGKLCSKLFKAYEALGGGKGPGAYRSKVSSDTSKVSSETLKDFYEAIGMKKATYYRFIDRTKKLIEAGADIENMSESMKAIADVTGKTANEIELEELVTELKVGIEGREKALSEYKEDIKKEQEKVKAAHTTIADLKEKAKAQTEPDPTLLEEIEKLEKRQATLAEEVDWLSTSSAFKREMTVFLDQMRMVGSLGEKIVSSEKSK